MAFHFSTVERFAGASCLGLLLVAAPLAAQDEGSKASLPIKRPSTLLHRALQVSAVAAPVLDSWTTLASNDNPRLLERNPLIRRADGTASGGRELALTSGRAALTLYMLHLAGKLEDEARPVRWFTYGVVALLNGLEYRAALHNYRADRRTR